MAKDFESSEDEAAELRRILGDALVWFNNVNIVPLDPPDWIFDAREILVK